MGRSWAKNQNFHSSSWGKMSIRRFFGFSTEADIERRAGAGAGVTSGAVWDEI